MGLIEFVLSAAIWGGTAMANENLVGNEIVFVAEIGYVIDVFDYRPETLVFMESNDLQGGGPTWMALTRAALTLESPSTLSSIAFDDEGDVVRITASSKEEIETVQSVVARAMSDLAFRRRCIDEAAKAGYLE